MSENEKFEMISVVSDLAEDPYKAQQHFYVQWFISNFQCIKLWNSFLTFVNPAMVEDDTAPATVRL